MIALEVEIVFVFEIVLEIEIVIVNVLEVLEVVSEGEGEVHDVEVVED